MAKINLDKYYTPKKKIAKSCIEKTFEVIGKENITEGNWKVDCGLDELSENLYQTIIYSDSINTHSVAHAFGKTVEESTANAKIISKAKDLELLIKNNLALLEKIEGRIVDDELREYLEEHKQDCIKLLASI